VALAGNRQKGVVRRREAGPGGDLSYLRRAAALYFRLVGASIRARMQYKANFILTLLIYGLLFAVDFIIIAVILYRFRQINTWSLYEVGLLFGTTSLARGISEVFARELDVFERYLIDGYFDSLLIRPWPTLFILLTRNIDPSRGGAILQGVLVLLISCSRLVETGELTRPAALYISLLLPVAGALIYFALVVATAASGFWLTRIGELRVFTMYAPTAAASYPLEIYPGFLRGLLYSVVPIAFAGYVPVRYLLGRGGSTFDLVAPFLVAAVAFAAAYRFWQAGERRYTSTGS